MKTDLNTATKKYLLDADAYWVEKGYDKLPNCAILQSSNIDNDGWMYIREEAERHVHLSRFVVDNKKGGLGTDMINRLKEGYRSISAWVKPDLFPFYVKNKFEIQYDSKNDLGYYYCVWSHLNL
jgi:hypothetical protein